VVHRRRAMLFMYLQGRCVRRAAVQDSVPRAVSPDARSMARFGLSLLLSLQLGPVSGFGSEVPERRVVSLRAAGGPGGDGREGVAECHELCDQSNVGNAQFLLRARQALLLQEKVFGACSSLFSPV
jgi:hypothetical protein